MSSENRRLCTGTFFAALSVLLYLPVALIYCWQYFWIFMINTPWWESLFGALQTFPAGLRAFDFWVEEAPLMIMGLVVVPVSLVLHLVINLLVHIRILKLPIKKDPFLWYAVLGFAVMPLPYLVRTDSAFVVLFIQLCMPIAVAGAGVGCIVTLVRCVKRLRGVGKGAALENAA